MNTNIIKKYSILIIALILTCLTLYVTNSLLSSTTSTYEYITTSLVVVFLFINIQKKK